MSPGDLVRRRVQREGGDIAWEAARHLRRRGHSVWRCGVCHHTLDGSVVCTSWLVDMARVEGFRPIVARVARPDATPMGDRRSPLREERG